MSRPFLRTALLHLFTANPHVFLHSSRASPAFFPLRKLFPLLLFPPIYVCNAVLLRYRLPFPGRAAHCIVSHISLMNTTPSNFFVIETPVCLPPTPPPFLDWTLEAVFSSGVVNPPSCLYPLIPSPSTPSTQFISFAKFNLGLPATGAFLGPAPIFLDGV